MRLSVANRNVFRTLTKLLKSLYSKLLIEDIDINDEDDVSMSDNNNSPNTKNSDNSDDALSRIQQFDLKEDDSLNKIQNIYTIYI